MTTEIETLKATVSELEARVELYKKRQYLINEINRIEQTDRTREKVMPIIQAVADRFGVVSLLTRDRHDKIPAARHMAMTIIREVYPEISLCTIGRVFYRDHAAVMHSIKAARVRFDIDINYQRTYRELKAMFLTSVPLVSA